MKNYLVKQLYRSLFYPLLFLALVWLVFYIQNLRADHLTQLGVLPREARGLAGILLSVFIHNDFSHIASNSIPLLVLGLMLFFFYRKIAVPAFIWIWLISGLWLWIGGRNNAQHPTYHIGASTLVYGLATFLFFSGVFRRHLQLMAASAMVVFMYGGIMWGIFPLKTEISWEGHLFGSLAGVLVAFNYREEGPQRRRYDWENETDEVELLQEEALPDLAEEVGEAPIQLQDNRITGYQIRYIYKEEKGEDKSPSSSDKSS